MQFRLISENTPKGDQPAAIEQLVNGINEGVQDQVLLGITGSGKTFTIANVIQQTQRPTLVLAHNKTLAAQLYQELKTFFPENAVEYFVSYYDYYQPEAYVPAADLYIEKEATVNEEIDRLRLSATRALFERHDVIVVASVSCIYGLGDPDAYYGMLIFVEPGMQLKRDDLLQKLVELQYERVNVEFDRGTFRVRGDVVELYPSYQDQAYRIEFWGDEIDSIYTIDPLLGEVQEHGAAPAQQGAEAAQTAGHAAEAVGQAAQAAGHAAESAGHGGGHHVPWLVEQVNHLIGLAVFEVQKTLMPPIYKALKIFGPHWPGEGKTYEQYVAGGDLPIPTQIVMFALVVIVAVVVIRILRGKLSTESPTSRQQTFEVGVEAIRNFLSDLVGPGGMKHFPVVMTFAILILLSNLLGMLVQMNVMADVKVMKDSLIVREEIIFHPDSVKNKTLTHGSLQWFVIKRDDQVGIRLRDLQSRGVEEFSGIERYDVDPEWRVGANLEVSSTPRRISITNVLGQTTDQISPGTLVFERDGQTYKLDALEGNKEELFIIVGDSTNVNETYPSGRYLYVKMPDENGKTIIDFNKSYNPPCAFTPFVTCPLPPSQNVLPIAIRSGEKNYKGVH